MQSPAEVPEREGCLEFPSRVELHTELSVPCGLWLRVVRVQAREQAQAVLGGAVGGYREHDHFEARFIWQCAAESASPGYGSTTSGFPRRSVRCHAVSMSLSGIVARSKVSSPDRVHSTICPYTVPMVSASSPLAAP